ncbi:hypothetical protein [Bacillus sp. SG-1]|uniref:hypothetical protein n=1 Tax=Bacillus sp. SG-1 TaxID=161544 RepID=UPI000154364A|nr:hypothetical protein [Bacillus sp. SG-1]EDL66523.1 hypothetical protein BSG1_04185 [Bacillus sp. SG-1]
MKKFILVWTTFLLFILGACKSSDGKDIIHIRQNLEDYQAETVPYEEEIQFTLTTKEILEGVEEPRKITTVHDTEVFLAGIEEEVNELNNKHEILVFVGLDGKVEEKGTLLSTFRLNEDDTYTSGPNFLTDIRAINERGEDGDFGGTVGDYEGRFEQRVLYVFEKDELMGNKEWTFEIEGLYLLEYQES